MRHTPKFFLKTAASLHVTEIGVLAAGKSCENLGVPYRVWVIWKLMVYGSQLRFDAYPYAWMEAGNLHASLSTLSIKYNAIASLRRPTRRQQHYYCIIFEDLVTFIRRWYVHLRDVQWHNALLTSTPLLWNSPFYQIGVFVDKYC